MPLERARDEQEQEEGPLRLTSARVARAHAGAVGRAAGEHFFYASTYCLQSLCWVRLTWLEDAEDEVARDEE